MAAFMRGSQTASSLTDRLKYKSLVDVEGCIFVGYLFIAFRDCVYLFIGKIAPRSIFRNKQIRQSDGESNKK
jgi:hypothetical protein